MIFAAMCMNGVKIFMEDTWKNWITARSFQMQYGTEFAGEVLLTSPLQNAEPPPDGNIHRDSGTHMWESESSCINKKFL